MSKHRTSMAKAGKRREEWPLVIYVWIIGLGVVGYLLGRVALEPYPHPVHWASGLVGAAVGYFVGWAWYRWRGDIA